MAAKVAHFSCCIPALSAMLNHALDAPATGWKPEPMTEQYIKELDYPHHMQKRKFKTFVSTTIVGKLYDMIDKDLKEFMSKLPKEEKVLLDYDFVSPSEALPVAIMEDWIRPLSLMKGDLSSNLITNTSKPYPTITQPQAILPRSTSVSHSAPEESFQYTPTDPNIVYAMKYIKNFMEKQPKPIPPYRSKGWCIEVYDKGILYSVAQVKVFNKDVIDFKVDELIAAIQQPNYMIFVFSDSGFSVVTNLCQSLLQVLNYNWKNILSPTYFSFKELGF